MAFTFFFRDRQTLDMITENLVPAIRGLKKAYLWDAGCAMGPEPYSLAIVLAENMGKYAFRNLHIDATDIDPTQQFGKTITAGVYPNDQVKRIPKPILDKYFHQIPGNSHFKIDEMIRSSIVFQKHDLCSLASLRENYHLVVCKNVLLHLQYSERVAVIKMFHKALVPGGFLAMEQTQKIPPELERYFTQVTPVVQLYKKVEL